MKAYAQRIDPAMAAQRPWRRAVPTLVAIALIASSAAYVYLSRLIGLLPGQVSFEPQEKPLIYYLMHSTGIFAALGAGILAGFYGAYRRLSKTLRGFFWLLQATTIAWALVAYGFKGLFSTSIFGPTGPFVWFTCVLVFAGMEEEVWEHIEPVIYLLSYAIAGFALFAAASMRDLVERWGSEPVRYMTFLMWFGGWTFLRVENCRGWGLYLRFVPYLAFVLCALYTRTRSWLILGMLLLFAQILIGRRSRDKTRGGIGKMPLILLVLITLFTVAAIALEDTLPVAIRDLLARTSEDTRSEQYVQFFSDVKFQDLILGRGPTGTWSWWGREYQFIDNPYIWTAFIGGLPTLVSYLALVILPGVRSAFKGAKGRDAVASALLILWALVCAGLSTFQFPSLTPYGYLLNLMAGRCLGYLADSREPGGSLHESLPRVG